MPTKITLIYDNPADPAAFEAGYPKQLELAKALPGLERIESSKVWPKEDGSPTPAYRLVSFYFAGYDEASAAVSAPAFAALYGSIQELATGGIRITFDDIEDV